MLLLAPLLLTTHYGDPNVAPGCQHDERKVKVNGIAGDFCSPQCNTKTHACPTDKPAGVTATPACLLKAPTGAQYCALKCSTAVEQGSCGPKASCKGETSSRPGICT